MINQVDAALELAHRALDLRMALVADHDELVAVAGKLGDLDVHLGDQRAGRVEHREAARRRLLACALFLLVSRHALLLAPSLLKLARRRHRRRLLLLELLQLLLLEVPAAALGVTPQSFCLLQQPPARGCGGRGTGRCRLQVRLAHCSSTATAATTGAQRGAQTAAREPLSLLPQRILPLARERGMAVVLVEQYFEFARDLADRVAVMVRGEVALGGPVDTLDDAAVRRLLTV